MKSKVYFTRIITPEKVLEMYEVLGKELIGKIAVKLHSGEEGNQNFLKPDFWRPIIDKLNGTVVECNLSLIHIYQLFATLIGQQFHYLLLFLKIRFHL